MIPAAGQGSRFLPVTRIMPKELLPLGNWPLIHHAIREATAAGFEEAIIVISPHKTAIRAYFESDPELAPLVIGAGSGEEADLAGPSQPSDGIRIRFIESPTRGPGEAVLLARQLTGDSLLAVLLPDDVVTGVNHWLGLESRNRATGQAGFCVRRVRPEETARFGMAVCDEQDGVYRVRHVSEKPEPGTISSDYSIFGRYLVTEPIIDALEGHMGALGGELQLTDGFASCVDRAPGIFAIPFDSESFDCGTPLEYARSSARYAASYLEPPDTQSGIQRQKAGEIAPAE